MALTIEPDIAHCVNMDVAAPLPFRYRNTFR